MARRWFRDKIRRMHPTFVHHAASYLNRPTVLLRLALVVTCAISLTPPSLLSAQSGLPKRELLWPSGAPDAVGTVTLDQPSVMAFPAPRASANGTAVVIFPGGGYTHLATEKEGTKIAVWLNTLGVSAFVVTYRLGPRYHHPTMLYDAQRAIRTVRARAREWGVDSARVGVMGFSAGGHLASTLSTHADAGTARDAIDSVRALPDFQILMYPVITMRAPSAHNGSRAQLLGEAPTDLMADSLSNELQVTSKTPPTFLVHATDDRVVPVENSLLFYAALRAANVPVELHIFQTGGHGFGMAPDDPALAMWMPLCAAWLRNLMKGKE